MIKRINQINRHKYIVTVINEVVSPAIILAVGLSVIIYSVNY